MPGEPSIGLPGKDRCPATISSCGSRIRWFGSAVSSASLARVGSSSRTKDSPWNASKGWGSTRLRRLAACSGSADAGGSPPVKGRRAFVRTQRSHHRELRPTCEARRAESEAALGSATMTTIDDLWDDPRRDVDRQRYQLPDQFLWDKDSLADDRFRRVHRRWRSTCSSSPPLHVLDVGCESGAGSARLSTAGTRSLASMTTTSGSSPLRSDHGGWRTVDPRRYPSLAGSGRNT